MAREEVTDEVKVEEETAVRRVAEETVEGAVMVEDTFRLRVDDDWRSRRREEPVYTVAPVSEFTTEVTFTVQEEPQEEVVAASRAL